MLHLARGDEDGGARREPHDHGMGDEIDQCAQPGQAEGQLIYPRQEGEGQYNPDVSLRTRFGQGADGGEDDNGDGGGGAGYQMKGGTEKGCHHGGDDGGVKTVFRREPGDHCKSDALGQDDDGAGESGQKICPERIPADEIPPAQEGEDPS